MEQVSKDSKARLGGHWKASGITDEDAHVPPSFSHSNMCPVVRNTWNRLETNYTHSQHQELCNPPSLGKGNYVAINNPSFHRIKRCLLSVYRFRLFHAQQGKNRWLCLRATEVAKVSRLSGAGILAQLKNNLKTVVGEGAHP